MNSVDLTLWRDHEPQVRDLPGISLGVRAAGPDGWTDPAATAAELFRGGVRRVAFDRPVELVGVAGGDPTSLVQTMVLLRELTSWGIMVDWVARLGEHPEVWQRLNHLYPPTTILDYPEADEALAAWRETFYLCKCVHRHGPGFIQVRDRRAGELRRFTIDDPDYLAAVARLLDGAPADSVPAHVLQDYLDEGLAGIAGHLAWWLPYRVRRWPWPSLVV